MDRHKDLSQLKTYIETVDKDVTMILQSLQWDRKRLLESPAMITCQNDVNHRIPLESRDIHEQQCALRSQGYSPDEQLLPEPPDAGASTLVTLTSEDINKIIHEAAQVDPLFKKALSIKVSTGAYHRGPPPQSASRLQCTYTADERRAIHDAVVAAAPNVHDLAELALDSTSSKSQQQHKSRNQVLAELRDSRRRRARYRVAGSGCNYSHALRGVIAAQMELFTGVGVRPNEVHNSIPVTVKIEKDDDESMPVNTGLEQHTSSASSRENDIRNQHKERHSDYSIGEGNSRDGTNYRKENYDEDRTRKMGESSSRDSVSKCRKDYDGDRSRKHKDRSKSRHYKDRYRSEERTEYNIKQSRHDDYDYRNETKDRQSRGYNTDRERNSKYHNTKYENRHETHSKDSNRDRNSSRSKHDRDGNDVYSERDRKEGHRYYDSSKIKTEPNVDGYQDCNEHARKLTKHY